MGGIDASFDVLVALPSFPHFSHLYPESRCSLLMNRSRAWVTSASGKLDVGDVERDNVPPPPPPPPRVDEEYTFEVLVVLLVTTSSCFMGKISNPISSIGSILQEVDWHAEHLTLDSTVPRNRRNGYSLSSLPMTVPRVLLMLMLLLLSGIVPSRATLQLVCIASINNLRNSCESSCTPRRNHGATWDIKPDTNASGTKGASCDDDDDGPMMLLGECSKVSACCSASS